MQQLDEMLERLQTAEGRCRHYQIECRHLVRSLTAVEETCGEAQRRLNEETAARQSLRQELVTTAASYETQVAAMSDHLAGLNETLAAQRDQIDQLRYQLGQRRRANR
ncbi:protein phosphatase 1 regulatory subunit 21-like [Pollicipes pollicipes]|uniref:protein phosphatase 1 regulatory subunit 21-like n=1 Tax=Pollicipes pollicipes TaxID=41117 RepID=UPI0018850D66|nr:protein phosphatase 1 regulatory subunit 21-like [Pollicipes pollicipes]